MAPHSALRMAKENHDCHLFMAMVGIGIAFGPLQQSLVTQTVESWGWLLKFVAMRCIIFDRLLEGFGT